MPPGNNLLKNQFEKVRRKLGPPYGNTNAVTHGLYATVLKSRGPEGVSRRVVNNLKGEIVLLKDFTFRLYELGLTLKDPLETASILRAMSLATLAITRLLDKHEEFKPPSPLYVQWKRESDPTFTTEDYPFPGTYDEDDPNPPGDKIEVGLAKANALMDSIDRRMKSSLPPLDDEIDEDEGEEELKEDEH